MIKSKTSSTGLDDGIKYVEIPQGWKRILENDSIHYVSPSSCCLKSYENVIEYLKTDGTCKCGLDCPFYIHHVFNFDASVQNKERKDTSQAVGNKSSCMLCESNRLKGNRKSELGLAASPLNQTVKHTAKKTIKPSTFDGTLTSKKVVGHSRTKLDSPKVKRSKKALSPLSDIPSPPPIPISSPVQNVPNNLGANQGPLPSFASIVSSSKFFNPGPNRGPLHPTGSLPLKTNEQNAFAFPKPISTAVASTSASVVTTTSGTIPTQVLETNRNHLGNLPMVNRIPAQTKSTPSPRVLVGDNTTTAISSASFTLVPTGPSVSVPLTTAAISTVASIISTPTLPSLFSPLDVTAVVSNDTVKLPSRVMSKSKPRARQPRAKPKPKTDQKSGAKSKTTKGTPKGIPTMVTTVSSMQPSFPIPSLAVTTMVCSPTSSYWPMPASSVTGSINQIPYQTSTFNSLSSVVPCTLTNLIGISTMNSSTNLTLAQPQVSQPVLHQQSILSSSIPISQNYQSQGARPQSTINSATGLPSVQATQTSVTQASSSPVDGKGSIGGQVLAASINYPVVATPRIQAQGGMMYVAATPGVSVFPSNYPYMAASAHQMQTSQGTFTQTQNAKSSLAITTMVTTSQPAMTASQAVSTEVGASQNQGKVSLQVPGMYLQGTTPTQMFPLNPQSFNMGQYKGTYQLPSAMYQTPVQGSAMTFIAPSGKGTYPGVQALATTNLGQFAYQNPYMFGIVMQSTTNQVTSATVTSTKSSPATSTCVTTSLQMIQQQTIQNPAVAAAFESFVPIAPAAGGQGPRFAQTLAHLASAYNTFPSPGIVQGPNSNQIQLAYQMMQMGSNATHQQPISGMAGLITPDVSQKHQITQSVKQSLLSSMAAPTQVTTKPQSVTQSATSTITTIAQTTRENPTGMRSPLSTGNSNSSLSSPPCSFSSHTTASASAQSTLPSYPVSTDTMSYNQRTLQSPPQNQIPQPATITSPATICNSPKTSYQSTSSGTGPSKTTSTTHESQMLSHFEPSNCTASKSPLTSTFSKATENTSAAPSEKCLGVVGTDYSEQSITGQKPVIYGPYSTDQTQKMTVVSPNGKDALAKKLSFEIHPQQHHHSKCDSNNISPLRTSNFPVSTEHKMNLSIENTGPFINKPCTTGSVLSPTEVPSFTSTEREGASIPSDSKTATRTVGGNDSVKQTKYESDANYYATNPLLGMKRSCEAIEVYPDPPESMDCDDERDDYCSSTEDPMERDPMHEDGSMETVRDLRQHGDKQHVEDKFLVTNQVRNPTKDMYNGGCNEVLKEQEIKNEHLGVSMKAAQAFPPFRTEMLGELSIPHVRPHFDIGDVVWAQARGLPSWPGQIVDESKVGKGRADDGKKWVMWFGDHTFSQVEVDRLKTLSEGLRTLDDKTRKKKYRAKKARISMEQAINEALEELDVRERLKAKQGMRAKTKKKRLR